MSVDGGPWQPADVVYNDGQDDMPSYLWALWRFMWDATVGTHTLSCRATYEDGQTQLAGRKFPYSGGSISNIELRVTTA